MEHAGFALSKLFKVFELHYINNFMCAQEHGIQYCACSVGIILYQREST